jgi:hypothetical protein
MGRCLLLVSVVCRGAAIGGVMALVVQACGPTPLGAVVRGVLVNPAYAGRPSAVTDVQAMANSLPHLHIPHAQTLSAPADDQ